MAEDQTPENVEETADAPGETAEAEAPWREAPAEATPAGSRAWRPRSAASALALPRRPRPGRGPRVPPRSASADRVTERAKKAASRRAGRAKATAKHKAEAPQPGGHAAREHVVGQQKVRQGIVVSDKADKTITVRIDTARRHRRYEKIVRTSRTLHAHDESNDAHIGDTVIVREARPLSRSKRWRLVEVVERAK